MKQLRSQIREQILSGLKNASSYQVALNNKQYMRFKMLLDNELIYLHGNHHLTGAPFFAGGIPHVELFQWGNLIGIVKTEEILGETALDANVLIYFEEKQDRTLAECMHTLLEKYKSHSLYPEHINNENVDSMPLLDNELFDEVSAPSMDSGR